MKRLARRRAALVMVLGVALTLALVAPAAAALTIYVSGSSPLSLGVASARLTKSRSSNAAVLNRALGARKYTKVDAAYYPQIVYLDCWGTKLTSGRNRGKYPLHMWSKKVGSSYPTKQFTCYGTQFVTYRTHVVNGVKHVHGVRVGSSSWAFRHAFAGLYRTRSTSSYYIYTVNSAYRWRTDFYVPKSGTGAGYVSQISMWTY